MSAAEGAAVRSEALVAADRIGAAPTSQGAGIGVGLGRIHPDKWFGCGQIDRNDHLPVSPISRLVNGPHAEMISGQRHETRNVYRFCRPGRFGNPGVRKQDGRIAGDVIGQGSRGITSIVAGGIPCETVIPDRRSGNGPDWSGNTPFRRDRPVWIILQAHRFPGRPRR